MLRWVIPDTKEDEFKRAEDILRQYEQSLEDDSEVKSWGRRNWSFPSALCAPANRPVMLSFLNRLNINGDRSTRLHLVFTPDLHRAASAALWKQITDAGEYLKEFIKRQREKRPCTTACAAVWSSQ